jgi:hypothetical protein
MLARYYKLSKKSKRLLEKIRIASAGCTDNQIGNLEKLTDALLEKIEERVKSCEFAGKSAF